MGAIHQALLSLPGAAGGFVPTDIASIDWWLTADSLVLSDGDPVSSWLDSSGAGKDYGQSTGAQQPTYKENILNNKPVVRFATNDKLIPNPNTRTYGATNTFIMVCTPSSTTNSYIFGGDNGGGVPAFISGFSSKSFEYFNGGSERATFAASTSGFHVLTVKRTDGSGNAVGYLDGAEVFSIPVSVSDNWNLAGLIEIGANGNGAGEDFFNGDIAQMLHFNAILTTDQLNNVHNYLGDEYGISITPIP